MSLLRPCRRFREQARSHQWNAYSCGSELAREVVLSGDEDHLGFFSIRNALALASTTRYITTVINSGSKK